MKDKIQQIEVDVLKEMGSIEITRDEITAVGILANRYSKIIHYEIGKYYGLSKVTVFNYNKTQTHLSKSGIRAINKFKDKYSIQRLAGNVFKVGELENMKKKMTLMEMSEHLNIKYPTLRAYFASDKPIKKPEKAKTISPEYKRLQELGYKNATDYIIEHGSNKYRENILTK